MYNCTIVHVHVRRTMTKMMILFVGGQNGQTVEQPKIPFPHFTWHRQGFIPDLTTEPEKGETLTRYDHTRV